VVERIRKLNKLGLARGENPSKLFEGIKAVDNQFNDLKHKLTEDDKIAVVLEKASADYLIILANTARYKGAGLVLDDLEKSMRIQWRIEHGDDKTGNGKDFSLSAFQGTCYNCGQQGHRANKCP
jgi:hypothetical protein